MSGATRSPPPLVPERRMIAARQHQYYSEAYGSGGNFSNAGCKSRNAMVASKARAAQEPRPSRLDGRPSGTSGKRIGAATGEVNMQRSL